MTLSRILSAIALGACGLAAQSAKVIPAGVANVDGNSATPYFSGYGAGRAQQVIDGAAIAKTSGAILELQLRADGRALGAIPGRKFSQLKLSLGYTGKAPGSMSQFFAANRTGAQTVVFSGPYSLPAQPAAARPFNIVWKLSTPFVYTRSKGNLLVEFEVPGRPQKADYFLDAHGASDGRASVRYFGRGGLLSGGFRYALTAQTAQLRIGGRAVVGVQVKPATKPFTGLVLWGASNTRFGPVLLPFSLASVGAAGNFLNVSPDVLVPLSVRNGTGRVAPPIPSNPFLKGRTIYAQAALRDASANGLGLVLSVGAALTIAGGNTTSPIELIGTFDATSASGFKRRTPGGIVTRLVGGFN